jgi:hypothetical protein
MLERPVVGSFPGNGEVSTVHGSAAIRPVSGVKPTSRDRRSTDAFDPKQSLFCRSLLTALVVTL